MSSVLRLPGAGLTGGRRFLVARWLDVSGWVREITASPRARTAPVTDVVSATAWLLVLAAPASLVAGLAWGWIELVLAGVFLVVLMLVAVVFVLGGYQLEATLDLTRDRVVVGERAHGRVVVRNAASRRSLPGMIELPVGGGRADFDIPSLKAGDELEDLFAVPTTRRAVLPVGPVRAVRADPLQLLRRDQDLTEEQTLYVHPRTTRIQGSAAGLVRDLEGETVRVLTDSDVAFHALRSYVPGDDRRYIHWKTSARTGQLMVRQFEQTRRSHLLVVLSTRADEYASTEEFETAVSVTGSLGVPVLGDRQQLTVSSSQTRLQAPSPRQLLDRLSGIDFERGPRLAAATRSISRDVTDASVAILVFGSLVSAADMRRARAHLPLDVRCIAIKVDHGRDTSVGALGDLDVISLAVLDDLGAVIRRVSA